MRRHRRQQAFVVIGKHDNIRAPHGTLQNPLKTRQQILNNRQNLFLVGTQKMIISGNQPGLDNCRIIFQPEQMAVHAGCRQQRSQLSAVFVPPDNSDKSPPAAQSRHIGRRVSGAAQHLLFPLKKENRHRCFRRNTVNLAVQKPVQHNIPDTKSLHPGKIINIRRKQCHLSLFILSFPVYFKKRNKTQQKETALIVLSLFLP